MGGSQGGPGRRRRPPALPPLTWVSSRFCSFSIRMVCCCQPGAGGEAGAGAGPAAPEQEGGGACGRAESGGPGCSRLLPFHHQDREWGGPGTHRAGTGCSQQLPQAPGHLLHLGQQSPQGAEAPLGPKVLGGSREGGQRAGPFLGRPACLKGVPTGGSPAPKVTARSRGSEGVAVGRASPGGVVAPGVERQLLCPEDGAVLQLPGCQA